MLSNRRRHQRRPKHHQFHAQKKTGQSNRSAPVVQIEVCFKTARRIKQQQELLQQPVS